MSCEADKNEFNKLQLNGFQNIVSNEFVLTGVLRQEIDYKSYLFKTLLLLSQENRKYTGCTMIFEVPQIVCNFGNNISAIVTFDVPMQKIFSIFMI